MNKSMLVAVLASLAITGFAWAQESGIDAAKQFFAQYAALENAYDPGLADLYADEAFIKQSRSMPMGEPRKVTVSGRKYKTLLRENMPIAKALGDRSSYSDVTYTQEGEFIRIDALRYSEMRKRTTPFSIVVGPSSGGKWLIYEESSESRQ
ncbi:MAG: hypothetical protein JSU95_08280 [Betaproteobacteria bacterium]|nr:MAG: hypothetical protein JSU95_08280 [Betaproteobacteria bacterium]